MRDVRFLPRAAACLALVVAVSGSVLAAPAGALPRVPSPSGPSPVGTTPVPFGSFTGQNASALDSCQIGSRRVLVVSGDVTGYRAARAARGTKRLWLLDADTSRALASVAVSGPRVRRKGQRFDGGFVQAVLCRPKAGGKARIYLGGAFTRVRGAERRYAAMLDVSTRGSGLQVRVSGWKVPGVRTPVRGLAATPRRIVVVGGSVRSVSPSTGRVRWTARTTCGGPTSALYAGGSLYVGGLFTTLRGPDGTLSRNHGLARLDAATGTVASRRTFRTAITRNRGCSGYAGYTGANVLSLAHDAKRKRVITCEGGIVNGVRAVNRRTGRQAWYRRIDGDGQVCTVVGDQVFVGFHRSGTNVRVDARGCGVRSCGAMGAFLRLGDGRQTRWLPPTADLRGGGRNRDGRNNGVIGATRIGPWFVLTGGFDRVGDVRVRHIVRFRVG